LKLRRARIDSIDVDAYRVPRRDIDPFQNCALLEVDRILQRDVPDCFVIQSANRDERLRCA